MASTSNSTNQHLPKATVQVCQQRVGRLQGLMQNLQIGGLLISAEKDIQYLTGFVGHESLALITAQAGSQSGQSGASIISDSRYDEYLEPWRKAGACEVVMGTRHRLLESVESICTRLGVKRLGVQAEHITVAARSDAAEMLSLVDIVDTRGLVSQLRMIKDAIEIASLERAIAVAQQGLAAALERLELGTTENQFSAVLEFEMKWRGGQGAAFTPIIGAGANSSIIHHSTGHSPIEEGLLLIDWGCLLDGYNSDLTRTFAIGRMPAKLMEVYRVVLDAQMAAIAGIAPGRTCAQIDAIAREAISRAGYGEYFGHGLGHGLGMDVHEGPYFNNLAADVRLQPGMVMTVEPGVYLPGVGGVRIEDNVVVTGDGCRVLTNYPKDLESALIEAQQAADVHS